MATLESKIKEIIRDVRHKCAEKVLNAGGNHSKVSQVEVINSCYNAVMNTEMD